MSKPRVNVTVGIPCSSGIWHAEFGMSLVSLLATFMTTPVKEYEGRQQISIRQTKTSLLVKSRRQLIEQSIEHGSTHILLIDTDQTFPGWTLHKLLSHRVRVVGANVATKSIPSAPTARNKNDKWPGGDIVYTMPESKGLEEVWRVGTGLLLLDLDIFKSLPRPWFGTDWRDMGDGKYDDLGEDWFLMERLEAAGEKVYIDHDLSKEVGHIGSYEFKHDLVWAEELAKEVNKPRKVV